LWSAIADGAAPCDETNQRSGRRASLAFRTAKRQASAWSYSTRIAHAKGSAPSDQIPGSCGTHRVDSVTPNLHPIARTATNARERPTDRLSCGAMTWGTSGRMRTQIQTQFRLPKLRVESSSLFARLSATSDLVAVYGPSSEGPYAFRRGWGAILGATAPVRWPPVAPARVRPRGRLPANAGAGASALERDSSQLSPS